MAEGGNVGENVVRLTCIRDTNLGPFRTVTMTAVCCRWCVLFSHPSDFTPVCTTEVGRIAQEASEFFRRGVKLLGHSCDSLQNHRKWLEVSSTQMLILIAMIFLYVDMRLSSPQFGSFGCGPHINLTRQGKQVQCNTVAHSRDVYTSSSILQPDTSTFEGSACVAI